MRFKVRTVGFKESMGRPQALKAGTTGRIQATSSQPPCPGHFHLSSKL